MKLENDNLVLDIDNFINMGELFKKYNHICCTKRFSYNKKEPFNFSHMNWKHIGYNICPNSDNLGVNWFVIEKYNTDDIKKIIWNG